MGELILFPMPEPEVAAEREPLWREAVGQELRDERQDVGRTLADVAEEAGVSTQYLSEIERGRREPSSEVLQAVAGALAEAGRPDRPRLPAAHPGARAGLPRGLRATFLSSGQQQHRVPELVPQVVRRVRTR